MKQATKTSLFIILSALAMGMSIFSILKSIEHTPKIGYVQAQKLITNYEGFKEASREFQHKSAIWQANIDTLASEITTIKSKYQKDLPTLSAKEIELHVELIKSKEQQLQQYRQGIQQKASQEDQQMTNNVIMEVNAFIKEYGEKHNYVIIFGATEAGNIVYAKDALDLTEEVLDILNRRYKGES
jgi:outer membrane protein